MSNKIEQAHDRLAATAHAIVGFASDFPADPGSHHRMVPLLKMPGWDQVFLSVAISDGLFTDADRALLADEVAQQIGDRVRELILRGPRQVAAGTAVDGPDYVAAQATAAGLPSDLVVARDVYRPDRGEHRS